MDFEQAKMVVLDTGESFATFSRLAPPAPAEGKKQRPLFVFHHGAGFTAQTWQTTVNALLNYGDFDILTFDCRGHGLTEADTADMSLEKLLLDMEKLVCTAIDTRLYEIVLVGHSMGGAVVVDVGKRAKWNLLGVVVIDVVEGTAIQALGHMKAHLEARPSSFASLEDAVKWAYVSSCGDVDLGSAKPSSTSSKTTIKSQLKQDPETNKFVWRTDLYATEKFWQGWFLGLSEKFLAVPSSRQLILANTDRLDKPLTIGQIQGKFQMVVVPNVGHLIQEDAPDFLAKTLFDFWKRNARVNLPPAIANKLRPLRNN